LRIGISGHRDLGEDTADVVDSRIRELLDQSGDTSLIGVSCLADGADQIFARAALDAGGRLVVVIPSTDFRDRLPEAAHAVYDALLGSASDVQALPFADSTPEAHMAASRAMLDQIDSLVAVWDGEPARSFGGTADVVNEARARGIKVTVIWPDGARRLGWL
jgi:hypothetical protein